MVLEQVYQQPYRQVIEQQIVKPLGLSNTYEGEAIGTNANEAASYYWDNRWIKHPEIDMSIPLGAGSMVATTEDVARFFQGLFNGELISQQSLQVMTISKQGRALGLFPFPVQSSGIIGHDGIIDGFVSRALHFVDANKTYVLLTNGAVDIGQVMDGITDAVLDVHFSQ